MEKGFRLLENHLPEPSQIPVKDSFIFRYEKHTIEAALVQKLARVISGLEAALILNRSGFAQEQAAIQRTLDEIGEDITFLAYALITDEITDSHKRYLADFYQEDFTDFDDPVGSRNARAPVPRRKIRAYIARAGAEFINQGRGVDLHKTLHQTYSGYVHAVSSQIMETYGGIPPRFHVRGMKGTPRETSARKDLHNYFYRGLMNLMFVAMAFVEMELVEDLYIVLNDVQRGFGLDKQRVGK